MITPKLSPVLALFLALAVSNSAALAVSPFTETFDTDDANWLDGASGTPTYNATGGVGDSGFISYAAPAFNSGAGGFGDPLTILFRGNGSDDASGDAFVGDWLSGGIGEFSVAVRHNNATPLNLFARFDAGFGAGASLANDAGLYSIAPDTWTTITIPIVDSNPPFLSYGAAGPSPVGFTTVFSSIQSLQLGFYLPANTDFDNLRMDIDNVAVAVPEVSSLTLIGLGMGAATMLAVARRRRVN